MRESDLPLTAKWAPIYHTHVVSLYISGSSFAACVLFFVVHSFVLIPHLSMYTLNLELPGCVPHL